MSNVARPAPQHKAVVTRLSVMMFLQFFAWGAWFATLGSALDSNKLGAIIGDAYGSAPIAAIIAPLFLGLIADRLFASQKVMGVIMLLGGAIMCAIPGLAAKGAGAGNTIVWLMIAYMLCYMPTLGLSNTITFTHLKQEQFPKVRAWGTIGWIVAGLILGLAGWSASLNIFWLGAISSLLLGGYCFTLPNTPPPAHGKPLDFGSMLMMDAWKLLKNPPFFVFAACSTLICIPLAYYYGQTSIFLKDAGFKEAGSAMTLGQMSEIFFMILIPFFFRKLGVKVMLMVGMGCWVARYALFAAGAPQQVMWMLLLAVALHGICYDFFFVTGFIYTDKKAPVDVRGQAQGLMVFLTQGVGMFFGYRVAFGGTFPFTNNKLPNTAFGYGVAPEGHPSLLEHIDTLKGQQASSFLNSLKGMFSKGYPEGIDQNIVSKGMNDWQNYWYFPAGLAAVVLVIFTIAFWDNVRTDEDPQPEAADAAEANPTPSSPD